MKKMIDDIRNYIEDIKSGKKKLSKDGMLILLFSGILIYVILLPTNNNTGYKNEIIDSSMEKTTKKQMSTSAEENYQTKLERELSEFLSEVEGLGEVEVLIYLSSTEEYVVEKDSPSYLITSKQAESQSIEENKEEGTVYTVNGNGEQVPFITQTKLPTIEGVVIAAEGAGKEEVRVKIIRTVMALYGVEANKIDVLERKKS